MRVLITGGAGFIGSNLAQRCVDVGWDVTIVDDLSNGRREFMPKDGVYEFIEKSFSDEYVLHRVRNAHFDVIIHLAALPRVSYSVEYPLETNDVNVTQTLKLIEASKGSTRRFIFASSSSVYGGADVLPTTEAMPKNPQSPYALQKSIIEDYLELYRNFHAMDSVSLRFFNVFGPNQLGDSPYATAVAAWLTAIKRGQPMRSDGDGTQSRDICYVDNVVSACMLAAANPKSDQRALRLNVACGERTTNNEIMEYLMKRYHGATKQNAPRRAGDVMHTHADVSLAAEKIGYVPLVSAFAGVEKTCDWFDQNWDLVSKLKLKI